MTIEPVLLLYPTLERPEEWGNHVKTIVLDKIMASGLMIVVLVLILFQCGQVGETVPVDFGDFFARTRLEIGIHWHTTEDIEHHVLFSH